MSDPSKRFPGVRTGLDEIRRQVAALRPEGCCKPQIMRESGGRETVCCSNDCPWKALELIIATTMVDADLGVSIAWPTAEYLSVLVGQVPFGNPTRRRFAAADLGSAMSAQGRAMERSSECFQAATWDVTVKPKGSRR